MQMITSQIDSNYLIYAGAIGLFLGLAFLMFFLYRRIRWIVSAFSKKQKTSLRLWSSLRNLLLVLVWISIFGMALFLGFFLRAYHVFNKEEPVAEIHTLSLDQAPGGGMNLVHFFCAHSQKTRYLFIKGDQWRVEGDIIKWKHWLNFLGLHTRYRLTRLQGRYSTVEAEANQAHTIHSLTERENDPLWRYLYQYGPRLPLVSTVYGNAVFQNCENNKKYLIYVGTSGFIVRERQKKEDRGKEQEG